MNASNMSAELILCAVGTAVLVLLLVVICLVVYWHQPKQRFAAAIPPKLKIPKNTISSPVPPIGAHPSLADRGPKGPKPPVIPSGQGPRDSDDVDKSMQELKRALDNWVPYSKRMSGDYVIPTPVLERIAAAGGIVAYAADVTENAAGEVERVLWRKPDESNVRTLNELPPEYSPARWLIGYVAASFYGIGPYDTANDPRGVESRQHREKLLMEKCPEACKTVALALHNDMPDFRRNAPLDGSWEEYVHNEIKKAEISATPHIPMDGITVWDIDEKFANTDSPKFAAIDGVLVLQTDCGVWEFVKDMSIAVGTGAIVPNAFPLTPEHLSQLKVLRDVWRGLVWFRQSRMRMKRH